MRGSDRVRGWGWGRQLSIAVQVAATPFRTIGVALLVIGATVIVPGTANTAVIRATAIVGRLSAVVIVGLALIRVLLRDGLIG